MYPVRPLLFVLLTFSFLINPVQKPSVTHEHTNEHKSFDNLNRFRLCHSRLDKSSATGHYRMTREKGGSLELEQKRSERST